MYKHTFDNTILRSYDIRGIYEKTLTEKDAFMLGFFFGITVREKNPDKKHPVIVIGMDGRLVICTGVLPTKKLDINIKSNNKS